MAELAVYDNDPTLYLFTSLTAGSSHIVTATSRIETILKANKIPFKGVDTATDELARKLYGRRARGKKLPLLVKEGYVIADLEQVEEWNEYDELKEALGAPAVPAPTPAKATPAPAPAATPTTTNKENEPAANPEQNLAIRQLGAEAAKVAAAKKPVPEKISTTNPLLAEKVNSPAVGTPTKGSDKPDTSSILSPRSIPLPATPNPAAASPSSPTPSSIPKIAQKPVHAPPSMHIDASNPALSTGPISTTSTTTSNVTVASPAGSRPSASPLPPASPRSPYESPVTSFHGRSLSIASEEEIKQIELENSIAEVSSTEEEDSEDEKAGAKATRKEAVREDGEGEGKEKGEKTQGQSATAADKAGVSVED